MPQPFNAFTAPYWHSFTLGGPISPLKPTADWNGILLVGKAPGCVEVIEGKPFAGPSGKLLFQLLESVGLPREEILITNAFLMQPAWTITTEGRRNENDVMLYFTENQDEGNDKLPPYRNHYVKTGPDEDIRKLWRLMHGMKPKLIIACGAIALWAVTGRDRIGDCVGQTLTTDACDAPVLATYHPAHALHKDSDEIAVKIQSDFASAKAMLATL